MICRMNTKIQVKKQNSLVDAIYRLSLNETRIFNFAIAKTDYKTHYYENITYFTLSELKDFYYLNSNNSYKEIKKALDELFERKITYYDHDRKGYITCRIITHKYEDKEVKLGLRFSEEISELIAVNKNFLTYKLQNTVGMTSPSAIRIYEILLNKLNKRHSKFQISVEELKKILGFEKNEYAKYSDFKRRVLEVAKKQINTHTDISFKYNEEKYKGKSVIDLIFISEFIDKNNIENKSKIAYRSDEYKNSNNESYTNIKNPFSFNEQFDVVKNVETSDNDRKLYIEYDLKEYIGIDDFMIKKYLQDYSDKLYVLEQQIKETLDAYSEGKVLKTKAAHFSHYIKYKD